MSRIRDIAKILGKTEETNTGNAALGIDGAGVTVYTDLDSLPTTGLTSGDQAWIESSGRLYISNGSGWYNVALINQAPYWDSEPLTTYTIADSATPLIITAKARDSDNSDNNLLHQSSASDSAAFLVDITRDSSVFTFTPKSQDSIGASVTAGDLTDSNTNDFIYTFKWSDGISFVTKAVTINYNFVDLSAFSTFNTSSMSHSQVNTQGQGSTKITANGASAWSVFDKASSNDFGGHDGHNGSPDDYPAYIAIDFAEKKPVNRLKIHVHANSFGHFELQGSNNAGTGSFHNSGTWSSLTFSTSDNSSNNQNAGGASSGITEANALTFEYNNDTAYRYYRLWIKDNSQPSESIGTRYSGWASYYWELYRV